MRPVVSPPISMPSYSRCAIRMVCAGAEPQGMRRRKADLAAGFLLQRRCGERRVRISARRFCLDRCYREVRGLDRFLEVFGFRAGTDIEPLDFLAIGADQP